MNSNTADISSPTPLRFITYLAPSIPIEFFQAVTYYLEEKLNITAYLMYESRWSGPNPDIVDPFTLNIADVAFICSTSFMHLLRDRKAPVELLPAGAVYMHARTENRPVYFSDIIVHTDNKERFKEFLNLRGCKWAYNDAHSLSGCYTTLRKLKQMGENASFFGHIVHSGSHVKSIKLVCDQTVEGAAIDSNCLALQIKANPKLAEQLHILESLGPMPIYPIAVNSKLPDKLKKDMAAALLEMHTDAKWQKKLNEFLVARFVKTSLDNYRLEDELRNDVSGVSMRNNIYY